MEIVVEGKSIVKDFHLGKNTVRVLDDVNVQFERGEFVSIMGPSGSGKSTLLYLLGGLDKPTSGQVLINNEDISKMNDQKLSVLRRETLGFVFQFYNLIPNLNIEENVLLPLLLGGKKIKKHQEELAELLNLVGLYDRRKHTPRELSGGQQQRVAIARALMGNPDVILADEPIGNLDSKTGTEIMQLFKKINLETKKTILQVTHSREAAEYGTRLIQLKDGKVWSNENN